MSARPLQKREVVTDKLDQLRHEVYRSAALFHGAMAKYFSVLDDAAAARETLSEITLAARESGAAYNTALVALLKHLGSLPDDAEAREEAERAERTISLLSFETRRLSSSP
jgi:Pyruvate/2-oxoacid:ferredoxin oxidoreductase gamma subunit